MSEETFLGDGAYASLDDYGRVVLTTGHHDPRQADNVVVLEPEVLAEFERWLAGLRAAVAKAKATGGES